MSFIYDINSLISSNNKIFKNKIFLDNDKSILNTNIYKQEKINDIKYSYNNCENNDNNSKEHNSSFPLKLNLKELINNRNEKLNTQTIEESTTKSLNEIDNKYALFKDKNNDKIFHKSNKIYDYNNKEENINLNKNMLLKFKIKNNKDNLLPKNTVMKYLSEKAIKYYLQKGKDQDINKFYANYLENLNDKEKILLKMVISSPEFISKVQKYKYNESVSLINEIDFLQKKINFNPKQNNENEINIKLNCIRFKTSKNNNLKNANLIKKRHLSPLKKNDTTIYGIDEDEIIKIKNNKIIDVIKKGNNFNNIYNINLAKNINYENIFVSLFINNNQNNYSLKDI